MVCASEQLSQAVMISNKLLDMDMKSIDNPEVIETMLRLSIEYSARALDLLCKADDKLIKRVMDSYGQYIEGVSGLVYCAITSSQAIRGPYNPAEDPEILHYLDSTRNFKVHVQKMAEKNPKLTTYLDQLTRICSLDEII